MDREQAERAGRVREFQLPLHRIGIVDTCQPPVQIGLDGGFDPEILPIAAVRQRQIGSVQDHTLRNVGRGDIARGNQREPGGGNPYRRLHNRSVAEHNAAPGVVRTEVGLRAKRKPLIVFGMFGGIGTFGGVLGRALRESRGPG